MFDYYYGNEAEQFSFLRVPKFLFTDKAFADLSNDGKILYSLMLDRMSLSVKSGWLDEKNRVYIIFTHEEAQQSMNCGRDKCTKIFKELEDIGLICRKKRGMGKPALIFVKNFVHDIEDEDISADNETEQPCEKKETEPQTTEKPKSGVRKSRSQEYGKTEVLTTENPKSGVRKNRSQDYGKTDVIKTDNIKTDLSETDFNQSCQSVCAKAAEERIDRSDYEKIIKENISYDILRERYADCGELVDEITELILDVVTGVRRVRVDGRAVPERVAAEKFLKLYYEHIEYVIENFSRVEKEIKKPDVYICTSLYNAVHTLNLSAFSGFTAGTGLALGNG